MFLLLFQLGNTSVLVTVVGSKEPSSSDMLPLTVSIYMIVVTPDKQKHFSCH